MNPFRVHVFECRKSGQISQRKLDEVLVGFAEIGIDELRAALYAPVEEVKWNQTMVEGCEG